MEYKYFPTSFATSLLASVGLHYNDIFNLNSSDEDYEVANRLYNAALDFQTLSLFNDFEAAQVAYHGVKLDEEQLAVLLIIHASSKTWAMGHVASQLLKLLEDDPKTAPGIAQQLVEQLGAPAGKTTDVVKRYVVKLADVDLEEEVPAIEGPK